MSEQPGDRLRQHAHDQSGNNFEWCMLRQDQARRANQARDQYTDRNI